MLLQVIILESVHITQYAVFKTASLCAASAFGFVFCQVRAISRAMPTSDTRGRAGEEGILFSLLQGS